jgi:hypothetical protein
VANAVQQHARGREGVLVSFERGNKLSGWKSLDLAKQGRNNRRRGQSGEREIVDLVRNDLGIDLKGRRLGQERDGGHDVDIGSLKAQVKRRKRLAGLYEWLEGADVACVRADGKGWLVAMPWETFVRLAREEIVK